jgi:DNA-binding Xre family transcriptional regulator
MKVVLDIKDNKATFFMELVKNFNFIKKIEIEKESTKKEILEDIQKSVKEVNLIKAGKLKGIPARDLINEL